jgi:hypothetical protein
MTTRDARSDLPAYADRARSAFFDTVDSPKPLGTFDLLHLAAKLCGSAVRSWIDRLEMARRDLPYESLIERVPAERMSVDAKKFATVLLEYNFSRIRDVAGRA